MVGMKEMKPEQMWDVRGGMLKQFAADAHDRRRKRARRLKRAARRLLNMLRGKKTK